MHQEVWLEGGVRVRIAAVTNIGTKKKIGQRELTEWRYSQLFDDMLDGICIINEFGHIEYVNRSYERLLRVNHHGETGKSIFHTQNDEVILTAYREKRPTKGNLNYYIGANQISVAASPIFHHEIFRGVIAIYREIFPMEKIKKKDTLIELSVSNEAHGVDLNPNFKEIVGKSKVMEKALLMAQKAAKTSATVLVRGESGTGKELVARAIHYSSERVSKPFVKVNCGAIPATLLESELFGHEQGAFTGAIRRKKGKFEQADGGTIFLDEIGDMPMEMQVKLLRVLQEREFERVGGEETIKCDVRIIAATNRPLEDLMEKGEFRDDLYYRLNVVPIHLPALKERKDDIHLLVQHFIEKICMRLGKDLIGLTEEAEVCLCNYDWPGNIRELENLMERLIVLTESDEITMGDLPSYISNVYQSSYIPGDTKPLIDFGLNGEIATLEEYEKEIIRYAIRKFGSFNAAGKALGVTHKTVAFKARKYNIIED